jgi:hypothetical protein
MRILNPHFWMDVLTIAASVLLTASVFYFSWLPRPQLSAQVPMPGLLAAWVDATANENLRTAVPFIFLGFLAGARLQIQRKCLRHWIIQASALIGIAAVAELGQLFLPARTCDLGDIGWAAAGAGAGLALALGVGRLYQKLRGAGGRSCPITPCPPADKLNDRS